MPLFLSYVGESGGDAEPVRGELLESSDEDSARISSAVISLDI